MTYNSESIKILEGLEPVRKRPGMYIGSTGSRGLHHMLWEIIDNSIDEYMAGYANKMIITLNKDNSISVEDNGRGIPIDLHEKGISAERIIFTTLHAGGKFDNDSYKVSGGLHGVGASVVNALSEFFEVEIYKDGFKYYDRYESGGKPVIKLKNGELEPVGKTDKKGTKITFKPDKTVFDTIEFKEENIINRLKELAYLNENLEIVFINKQNDKKIIFKEEEGLIGFLKSINKDNKAITDVVYIKGEKEKANLEVAFQYIDDYQEQIISFCNNINTVEGGTHVSGFKTCFTRTINQYARTLGYLKNNQENLDGKDIRSGIVCILSLKYPNPQYEGQTKTKLGNTEVKKKIDDILQIELQKYFDRNTDVLETIIKNAIEFQKVRKAEEKAKEKVFSKSSKFSTNKKLAHCQSKNPKETELFIVEGDSAGGSAKQGRDRRYQAVLPLKGKILNVEKKSIYKVVKNKEIASLISALGCGFYEGLGNDFDITKLRYGKIIILTDADVDGSHIRTLLLTFFYRYMPELIYEEKIYIGVPPLYKIRYDKKDVYLYTDEELEREMKKVKNKKYVIQRYKGLGEMNPEQLWETTMTPKTRKIKLVTVDSILESNKITEVLMGNNVKPRKSFIKNMANKANLDI